MSELSIDLKQERRKSRLIRKRPEIVNQEGRPSSYYRIENPNDVVAIGASCLEDFNRGAQHFVFASTNYKSTQQRAVLAVASYFDHLFRIRTLIVSDNLERGPFKNLVEASSQHIGTSSMPAHARFYHHFDFISLSELMNHETGHSFLEDYDLVLWDPPCLNNSEEVSKCMGRFSNYFDSVTIIVANAAAKSSDQRELRRHFDGFGINVSGIRFREILKASE